MREKFKETVSKFWRIIKVLAPIGFILSILFFVITTFNAKRSSSTLVGNLMKIEHSISTRHLGIFPDYLPHINEVLSRTEPGDSIVIFEDVLYYGLFFNPSEFKKMINILFDLSNRKHNIFIAYYDVDSRQFRDIVKEARISSQYLKEIYEKRILMIRDSLWQSHLKGAERYRLADSIITEKYFAQTRADDFQKFREDMENFLQPLYDEKSDDMLFYKIDSIRNRALNRPLDKITFADFFNMYRDISIEIATSFKITYNSRFNLIPLENYLVLSCWSNEKEILFALPGKYNADEIGFISHDISIHNYIKKQLNGAILYNK